jgi:ubiquinone/menaquinone biosynthesis C-methylase UbiE
MFKNALKNLPGIPKGIGFRAHLRDRLRRSIIVQKYASYPAKQGLYVLQNSDDGHQVHIKDCVPVPPLGVRHGYGDTEEYWLNGGKIDVDNMIKLLGSSNFKIEDGNRILELGCASGRMIRWLVDYAKTCEIWGVDVDARLIVWCQEYLTPPFRFATVTTLPHLPFEDNYFNLIYCGSVFTHIDDLADAWLLEIKRIMCPGGRVYITVLDKHSIDLIVNGSHSSLKSLIISKDENNFLKTGNFYKASLLPGDAECQVFYDINYLSEHWGQIFKIVEIKQEAYWFQTAVLMEKQ